MHVLYDPQKVNWMDNTVQFGGGQYGHGSDYNVFRGMPYQRVAGIGSVFRSMLRYLIPLAKPAGAAIGREALETGSRILSNIVKGDPVKRSVLSEGRTGLKNLLDQASTGLARRQQGQGQLLRFKKHIKGSTVKGRTLRSLVPPPSLATTTTATSTTKRSRKQTAKPRTRVDSLGAY